MGSQSQSHTMQPTKRLVLFVACLSPLVGQPHTMDDGLSSVHLPEVFGPDILYSRSQLVKDSSDKERQPDSYSAVSFHFRSLSARYIHIISLFSNAHHSLSINLSNKTTEKKQKQKKHSCGYTLRSIRHENED